MAQTGKTSTDAVMDAVCELHAAEQIVTREAVAQLTQLKLSVVDDRLGVLADDGLVLRVQRGVYAPAPVYRPARAMSKTLLPDGMVKIEIGDEVLTLTPKEDRMLAGLMTGSALQATAIESGRNLTWMAADLAGQLGRIRQRLAALER